MLAGVQISAVIVNNDETRIKDHLSGRNYKCAAAAMHQMNIAAIF